MSIRTYLAMNLAIAKERRAAQRAIWAYLHDAEQRNRAGDRGDAVRNINEAMLELQALIPERASEGELDIADHWRVIAEQCRARGEHRRALRSLLRSLGHSCRSLGLALRGR